MEPQSGIPLSERITSAAITATETGLGQQPKSAMDRITEAAEAGGAARIEGIMKIVKRISGAPEAAGMALTIAGETARDMQERAADQLDQAASRLERRIDNSIDRFTSWVIGTKDKAVAKAKDLGQKGLVLGLSGATKVEDRVVAIAEYPAELAEKLAGKIEEGAEVSAVKLDETLIQQAKAETGLDDKQMAAVRELIKKHMEEAAGLKAKHEKVKVKVEGKIAKARETATDLETKADGYRGKVEGMRRFKNWLAQAKA